jgi:hypothetical protein
MTLTAAALLGSFTAMAQPVRYELKFKAVAKTTSDSGKLVSRPLNERDIIRKCAEQANAGTTNLNRFVLVYEVNADYNGDVIRVVKKEDGSVVCSPFRVLFHKSLPDWEGRRDHRIAFLFNGQNTDTMGSVLIEEGPIVREDGSRGRHVIRGKLQMYDEVYYPDRKAILTGTFITGKQLNW